MEGLHTSREFKLIIMVVAAVVVTAMMRKLAMFICLLVRVLLNIFLLRFQNASFPFLLLAHSQMNGGTIDYHL